MASSNWSVETYGRIRPPRQGRICVDRSVTRVAANAAAAKSARPQDAAAHDSLELVLPLDGAGEALHPASREGHGQGRRRRVSRFSFGFTRVLDTDVTQEHIFGTVCEDMVASALAGYNGAVFAYGQTGSGKTFTMTGGERYVDRGLIPRTISCLFDAIEAHKRQQVTQAQAAATALPGSRTNGNVAGVAAAYVAFISYLEIYNESIYDLLDRSHRHTPLEQWQKIAVLDDGASGDLHLKHLRVYEATTEEDALSLLFLGNVNRVTSETPMNCASSRSHCIFTLTIEGRLHAGDGRTHAGDGRSPSGDEAGTAGGGGVTTSKLHLVDLAGSERIYRREGASARTQTEGRHINLSLHHLEQVVMALRGGAQGRKENGGYETANGGGGGGGRGSQAHVPYRNSMLTLVLRDSLGGNCRTKFLVTLNPELDFWDETVSTCRFAQRCAELSTTVRVNRTEDLRVLVQRLQRERVALVAALEGERVKSAGYQVAAAQDNERALTAEAALAQHAETQLRQLEAAAAASAVAVGGYGVSGDAGFDDAVEGLSSHIISLTQGGSNDGTAGMRSHGGAPPRSTAAAAPPPPPAAAVATAATATAACESDSGVIVNHAPLTAAEEEHCRTIVTAFMSSTDKTASSAASTALRSLRDTRLVVQCCALMKADALNAATAAFDARGEAEREKAMVARLEGQLSSDRNETALLRELQREAEAEAVAAAAAAATVAQQEQAQTNESAASHPPHHGSVMASTATAETEDVLSEAALLELLIAGATLVKHGRRGQPKARFISLSLDGRRLQWRKTGEAVSLRRSMEVCDLLEVFVGNSSRAFQRTVRGKAADVDATFVLKFTHRTMGLQVDVSEDSARNKAVRDRWVAACKMLVEREQRGGDGVRREQ